MGSGTILLEDEIVGVIVVGEQFSDCCEHRLEDVGAVCVTVDAPGDEERSDNTVFGEHTVAVQDGGGSAALLSRRDVVVGKHPETVIVSVAGVIW